MREDYATHTEADAGAVARAAAEPASADEVRDYRPQRPIPPETWAWLAEGK